MTIENHTHACQTCGHEKMAKLSRENIWWCVRCGSLLTDNTNQPPLWVSCPSIVKDVWVVEKVGAT